MNLCHYYYYRYYYFKSSLKRQEKDIEIARHLLNNSNSSTNLMLNKVV
jgi:hypothetical protein